MFDAFFTFLNFSIIAGLIFYGWTRFAVPLVEAMAQKQTDSKEALHDEHKKLLKEHQELDRSIVEQEEESRILSLKMIKWKEVVEQEQSKRSEEERHMNQELKQKIEERALKVHSTLIYQKVKPYVLTQLEEEARASFTDPEAVHLYIAQLLRGL